MLSSMETWGEEHEGFVLRDFYDMVRGWFADPTDEWVIDTLAYWNKYVFHLFDILYLFYMLSQDGLRCRVQEKLEEEEVGHSGPCPCHRSGRAP